jgi:hypothetical protein
MPADDGVRLHDDEHILPASPSLPQDGPEQPIQGAKGWLGSSPFEDRHLLAKCQHFESHVRATAEENADRGKECEYE